MEPQSQGRADRWWHLSVADAIVIHRQDHQQRKCEAAAKTYCDQSRSESKEDATYSSFKLSVRNGRLDGRTSCRRASLHWAQDRVDRTRLAVDPADRALLPAPEALSPAHSHHSNDGHSKIGALGIGHGPHFRQKQDGVKIPHAIKLRQGPECSDLNGRSEDRLEAQ